MKKIVALILSTLLILGSVFTVGCSGMLDFFNKEETPATDVVSPVPETSGGEDTSEGIISNSPTAVRNVKMTLGAVKTFSSPASETGDYIEREINVAVIPSTALQLVDYTVSWESASADDVNEYVKVFPVSDGSTKAYARCYKDFGDRVILITATSRDGGKTDTLRATFSSGQKLVIDTSNLTKATTEDGTEYYVFNRNWNELNLSLVDAFTGEVVKDGNFGDYNNSPLEFTVESDDYVWLMDDNANGIAFKVNYAMINALEYFYEFNYDCWFFDIVDDSSLPEGYSSALKDIIVGYSISMKHYTLDCLDFSGDDEYSLYEISGKQGVSLSKSAYGDELNEHNAEVLNRKPLLTLRITDTDTGLSETLKFRWAEE